MEFLKKQKKILAGFCIFLVLMYACTLISKAVYASKLPQVSVARPGRMAIGHQVEAEGIVHQGREYAVNALSGLRVRTVYAHVGDRVTAESVLFDVDLEDLEQQIREKEIAIEKLRLQISDQEKNRALQQEKEEIDRIRAEEDYERALEDAQGGVDKAERERQIAERNLKELKNDPVETTSEADRKAAQAKYDVWIKEAERLKAAMDQAKAEWDAAAAGTTVSQNEPGAAAAKEKYEKAKTAYENHMETPVAKPDYRQRGGMADSSLEINRLELSFLQAELAACKRVLETGGQICPEAEGIVTRIQVSPGERVPDGAAIVYADLTSPMQFTVSLTKEQKKYVNQGDIAELSLGNRKGEEYAVDYIAENEANPDVYEARILLEEGLGTIGQSGTFRVDAQSDTYQCCIPLAALHEDANHRKFVYIVSERSGILGKELAAEVVYVKVLDQNDSYAAIEEGMIDSETELITDATETIEDRTVVRYKE